MTTLGQPTEPISSTDVEEALKRTLAAESFANAPSLAAFLAFIVRETLEGRGDRLKAYTIAVGALDRSADFDPNENPLVRVQARRLRAALDRYRLGQGRDAPVHIELPIGSYVPVFTRGDAPPVAPPAVAAVAPHFPPLRALVAAALVGLALLAALLGDRWTAANAPQAPAAVTAMPPSPATASREGKDVGRVLPLLVVEIDVRHPVPPDFDAELYRRRLEDFAQRFDDTIVVTRRAPTPPLPAGQPVYVLQFAVVRDGGSTNAFHQLVHAADHRVLRSGALRLGELRPRTPPEDARLAPPLDEDLALVRDVVEVAGTIGRDLQRLGDLSPELRCLSLAWVDLVDASSRQRAETRRCLEAAVANNPRLVSALTLLATTIALDGIGQDPDEAKQSYDRAADLLLRANRLAPASAAPLRNLSLLRTLEGDFEAAALTGRRALDANPDDLAAVAGYGALMARTGEYERARLLLSRVVSEDPAAPKWVQFHAFLALNALGRTQEADDRVVFFEGTRAPLHLTAMVLRASRRGDAAGAAEAMADLRRLAPEIDTDPLAMLRRRGLAEPVARRLLEDLWAAGLPTPTKR